MDNQSSSPSLASLLLMHEEEATTVVITREVEDKHEEEAATAATMATTREVEDKHEAAAAAMATTREFEDQTTISHEFLDQSEDNGSTKRVTGNEDDQGDSYQSSKWPDLPRDIANNLIDRLLPSIPDFIAFSSICSTWRCFALARRPLSDPPFLLTNSNPSSTSHGLDPTATSICQLMPLTSYPKPLPLRLVPNSTLGHRLIGYSHGSLVFSIMSAQVLIVDIFTGNQYLSPMLPTKHQKLFTVVKLAKPLPSSSSRILMVAGRSSNSYGPEIIYWRVDSGTDGVWSSLQLTIPDVREVSSLQIFRGKIYALLPNSLVAELTIGDDHFLRYDLLQVSLFDPLESWDKPSLIVCDEKLVMVQTVNEEGLDLCWKKKFKAYSLDFLDKRWVKMEDLKNWSLFVDGMGKCAYAIPHPERWGGEGNCVYIARGSYEKWTVVPLYSLFDGEVLGGSTAQWRLPLWVFPDLH